MCKITRRQSIRRIEVDGAGCGKDGVRCSCGFVLRAIMDGAPGIGSSCLSAHL